MFDAALVRRPATTTPRPAPQPQTDPMPMGHVRPSCCSATMTSAAWVRRSAAAMRPWTPSVHVGPGQRRSSRLSGRARDQRRGVTWLGSALARNAEVRGKLAPRRRLETQGPRNAVTTGAAGCRPGRTWPDQPGNSRALVHLPQDRRAPRQQPPCQSRPAKPREGGRLRAQAPSWAQVSHRS
jgi:hypothetical protein